MLSFAVGIGSISKNKLPSRLSTSVACVLLLLTTACSQGETKSAQSTNANSTSAVAASNNISTLRIGYVGSSEPTGPLGWAKKKGILDRELQKAGFKDITFARFPNGPDLNEALVAGQLDVGSLGDTPAIVLRARGVETRLLRITQFNTTAWLVAKKNGARSLAELKGQKIATQKGFYMHRYLLGLLAEAKIPKDVKVVHLMTTEAKAALERGDVAAYAASSELGLFLKSQGFPVPGLISIALRTKFEEVVAIDPDPDMIAEAKQQAAAVGANNITWLEQGAELIDSSLGTFKLATIGRAFHWMERELVLERLYELLTDDGGLALLQTNDNPWESNLPWKQAALGVVKKWLGDERRTGQRGQGTRKPVDPPHQVVITNSAFARQQVYEVPFEKSWTVDSYLGYLYTTAFSLKIFYGDNAPAFEKDLKEALLAVEPSGHFTEELKATILVAWKH